MRPPAILISPIGYDNVNAVLQQLGGRLANTRQLQDNEFHYLKDIAFLKQFRHLFLNCHAMFRSTDPDIGQAVRNFVQSGGALYVSDWASNVVEAAFGYLVAFKRPGGDEGVISATVINTYLTQIVGRSLSINFDMGEWHSIDRLPRTADVYMWDRYRRPLAVGFSVGQGRIVYTSFHHHAQGGASHAFSHEEEELLKWLVTLPTQHAQLLSVSQTLIKYRGRGAFSQMVSRVGTVPQTIPLHLGSKPGVGVCSLSWEPNEHLELSMSYLRHDTVIKHNNSSIPPLTIAVRNPQEGDRVKVSLRILAESANQSEEMHPYVFGVGMRRDLLGDKDWFALAIARHIQVMLGESTSIGSAKERVEEDNILEILGEILAGLGYVVQKRAKEFEQERSHEVIAWSRQHHEDETPDLRIEVQIIDLTREFADRDEAPPQPLVQASIRKQPGEGTECLLVRVVFSLEDKVETAEGERDIRQSDVDSAPGNWRVLASEKLPLEFEEETVSAAQFAITHYLNIIVYRFEE